MSINKQKPAIASRARKTLFSDILDAPLHRCCWTRRYFTPNTELINAVSMYSVTSAILPSWILMTWQ